MIRVSVAVAALLASVVLSACTASSAERLGSAAAEPTHRAVDDIVTDRDLVLCLQQTGATVTPTTASPHLDPTWDTYVARYGHNGVLLAVMSTRQAAISAEHAVRIDSDVPGPVASERNVLYLTADDTGHAGSKAANRLVQMCASGEVAATGVGLNTEEMAPPATGPALAACLRNTGAKVRRSTDPTHLRPGWHAYRADYPGGGGYFVVVMGSAAEASAVEADIQRTGETGSIE